MFPEHIVELIKKHEGYRKYPYRDSVGILTIGYGRNLMDVGISEDEALFLLKNDIERAKREAQYVFPNFFTLDEVRQAVIIDMLFNLGLTRFLTFKKFIKAVKNHDFDTAADELIDSKWCSQVKTRCQDLAFMMRTGKWPEWLS